MPGILKTAKMHFHSYTCYYFVLFLAKGKTAFSIDANRFSNNQTQVRLTKRLNFNYKLIINKLKF